MCAVGVGGADAVDVMAGLPWELKGEWVWGKEVLQGDVVCVVGVGGADAVDVMAGLTRGLKGEWGSVVGLQWKW